jgi:hypothetical protein
MSKQFVVNCENCHACLAQSIATLLIEMLFRVIYQPVDSNRLIGRCYSRV